MGDYNLSALNTRDFEHLVQAIGKKVISPGVTPFGDGPDDGREATFDGPMDYPSNAASWNGYLVIQCKFRQRPEGTSPDGAWALAQLRDELKKYKENRISRKPDYFIYATNVTLSAAKNGWKDKVRAILQNLVDQGEIKGFDVWSYDELRTFLDDAESIRRAYAGFITGGDVLAEAIRLLGVDANSPDFRDVMMSYLQKELRADHAAKLESITQMSVPPALSSIFVDLPVSIFPTGLDSVGDESEDSLFALHSLLEAGQEKLNIRRRKAPDGTVIDDSAEEIDFCFDLEPDLDRCILIGGPGQGKSTLGQLLCQIYRAKFLDSAPKARLDSTVASMVKQILRHVEALNLPPAVCRFPFRLVLNTFAVDLSKNPSLTVLEALRERIEKHAAKPITRETLKVWLRSYPCVVIFDGLDEVPASSNRAQVLEAIHDFHIDVAGEQADIQFIATSRPQGYSEEFKQARYTHLYLRPLSTSQALSYGEKLVGARFPDDSDLRERVLRRLRVACENSSTQRLMRSPLQVTIMATLVERTGEAPRQRYRLFSDYYKTIFDREVSREGPLSRTMRDRQTIINVIHHRTGLLLQREAERTGSTEARLEETTFIKLVRHLLVTEIEEPEDKATRLIEQLKESSIDRLVFLIKPEAGLISYELRSLQEFMAAEALYVAETNAVKARLRAIAAIPYWRNVLLFFIGRAFSEQNDPVIDFVLELCEELNESEADGASSFSLSGSELALQIILDGVTDENPRRSRQFLKLALRHIEIPVAEVAAGLVDAYRPEWEAQYRQAIESRIHNPDDLRRFGACVLSLGLADLGVPWAQQLFSSVTATDVSFRDVVFGEWATWPKSTWAIDNLLRGSIQRWEIGGLPPSGVDGESSVRTLEGRCAQGDWLPPAATFVTSINEGPRRRLRPAFNGAELGLTDIATVRVTICSTSTPAPWGKWLLDGDLVGLRWAPYVATAMFLQDPSEKSLAAGLSHIADQWQKSNRSSVTLLSSARKVPWLLGAILYASNTADDLRAYADKALKGELGDAALWASFEEYWRSGRFLLNGLEQQIHTSELANLYVNALKTFVVMLPDEVRTQIRQMALAKKLNGEEQLALFGSRVLHILSAATAEERQSMSPQEVMAWYDVNRKADYVFQIEPLVPFFAPGRAAEWISLLTERCTYPPLGSERMPELYAQRIAHLLGLASENDPKQRYVYLLAATIAAGHKISISRSEAQCHTDSMGDECCALTSLLRLQALDLTSDEAKTSANQLAKYIPSAPYTRYYAIRVLEHLDPASVPHLVFATTLISTLSLTTLHSMRVVAGCYLYLQRTLAKRRSALTDDHVWTDLKLPMLS